MNNIKWESWVPYLEKPNVLIGFVVLLVSLIAFFLITNNRQNIKIAHQVFFCFLTIAAFVIVVAAYKSIQEPLSIPHTPSVPEKQESTVKPIEGPDLSAVQSNNMQIVNGSHNTITNQVGKTK
ncbi:hypothetical protein HX787_28355 [Pseudomonas tolaasii]|uniref:Uncharacterized protein n=1 Tax=Pseudomonas tolaasii TaxID=29442 RepID=A0A7Y8AVV6_PSETO|nr:hypothetical protein [Pseudomonas tolaasii]ARB31270.1 hypothetical protein B5P22_29500 [Pseudomonas tolaasii]KAB0466523.1 hypothetical protein F7R12_27535 [Pseudomonas tolaasii]MBY8943489.1 hypothetical protein [Pseudomonas tolaasii]NVZ45417.1 hypothetical protein [Pseudomonas tolaasii]NWA48603.1 hypothetical protein [Pseudomonas tolaasii]